MKNIKRKILHEIELPCQHCGKVQTFYASWIDEAERWNLHNKCENCGFLNSIDYIFDGLEDNKEEDYA